MGNVCALRWFGACCQQFHKVKRNVLFLEIVSFLELSVWLEELVLRMNSICLKQLVGQFELRTVCKLCIVAFVYFFTFFKSLFVIQ